MDNAYYKTSSPPALAATNKVANPAVKRFAHVYGSPLSSSSCFLSSGASSHNIFPFLLFSGQPGIEVLRNTSSTLSYPLLTVLFHLNLHFYFDFSFWMVLDVTIGIGKVKTRGQLVPAVLTDRWVDRSALYKS